MSPLTVPPGSVAVAVDVVVLALRTPPGDSPEQREPVFLARRRDQQPHHGQWSLPGGIVRDHEDLDSAIRRALARTGAMERIRHVEQLGTFGAPGRDPRGRVLSVSHLALVPEPVAVSSGYEWLAVASAPPLAFDHSEILQTALERLRGKLSYSNVAYGLLGETFTLSELQDVYEAVLDRDLDKRNFRKKVVARGLVTEAGGMRRGAHRPARLYRFRHRELVLLDEVI